MTGFFIDYSYKIFNKFLPDSLTKTNSLMLTLLPSCFTSSPSRSSSLSSLNTSGLNPSSLKLTLETSVSDSGVIEVFFLFSRPNFLFFFLFWMFTKHSLEFFRPNNFSILIFFSYLYFLFYSIFFWSIC